MIVGNTAQDTKIRRLGKPPLFVDPDVFYAPAIRILTKFDASLNQNVSLGGASTVVTNLVAGTCGARIPIEDGRFTTVDFSQPSGFGQDSVYFEVTLNAFTGGNSVGFGIADFSGGQTYTDCLRGSSPTGISVFFSDGHIYAPVGFTGFDIGIIGAGDTVGCFFECGDGFNGVWFRKVNSPATGYNSQSNPGPHIPPTPFGAVGTDTYSPGASIVGTACVFAIFGGTGIATNNQMTFNFGQAPFIGSPPSPSLPYWPAGFKLLPPYLPSDDVFPAERIWQP